jgi:hypothetical protein
VSKGSRRRPGNDKLYASNHESVFGKKCDCDKFDCEQKSISISVPGEIYIKPKV